MPPRRSPRKRAAGVQKHDSPRRSQPARKKRSAQSQHVPQLRIEFKLVSPTKADRWDPCDASPGDSPNYNLVMATARDLDEVFLEQYLMERAQNADPISENELFSDIEDLIPDWATYVDPYGDFEWLEKIEGIATYQPDSRSPVDWVGYCKAFLVRREMIENTFWDDMEGPEYQLAELGFELFDRFGKLKPELKGHPVKRGSGVWAEELNTGDILLVNVLEVEEPYQRQGIGSKLARALLELASKKSNHFTAVAAPSVARNELYWLPSEQAAIDEEAVRQDAARCFWRKLHFRRIGYSRWFGYSPDEGHASRSVPLDQDFDLPRFESVPEIAPEIDSLLESIPVIDDAKCLERLQAVFGETSPADTSWQATDSEGNTLLHLVVCSFKSQSTRWVLERTDKLVTCRNWEGNTPIEALEKSMERTRTISEHMFKRTDISDQFTGFDEAMTSCLVQLKGQDITELTENELLRLKFGCTCGTCLGGFLSPSVLTWLLNAAESIFDVMYEERDIEDGDTWCLEHNWLFDYLPQPIVQSLPTRKDLRMGFCMLWKYLAICLRENSLPTEQNILALIRNAEEWPPHCRDFIQKGGSVSSAATRLFQLAMEVEQIWHSMGLGMPAELSTCRNDREIGMASGLCGYERVTRVLNVDMRGRKIRC